jgi:hypothetical protein
MVNTTDLNIRLIIVMLSDCYYIGILMVNCHVLTVTLILLFVDAQNFDRGGKVWCLELYVFVILDLWKLWRGCNVLI